MNGTLEALVSRIRALGLIHASRHASGGPDEVNASGTTTDTVLKALFDANTILKADTDNTPEALEIAASRIVARLAAGGIIAATVQQVLNLLLTTQDDIIVRGAADPARLNIAASRIVGKGAAGNVVGLTGAQVMAILSGQAGADFAMNTHKITGVVDPAANQDAATKNWVDAGFSTKAHASRHEAAGGDIMNVTGLSGLLADDQHVLDAEVRAALNNIIGSDGKLDADLDADGHDITKLDALHFGPTPVKLFDWQTSKLIMRKAHLFDPSHGLWVPAGSTTTTVTGTGAAFPTAQSLILATGATSGSTAGAVGFTPFYHDKDLSAYRWGIAFRLNESLAQVDQLEIWAGMFADTTTFPTTASNHYGIRVLSTGDGVTADIYASSGNGAAGTQADIDDYAALYSKEFVILFGANDLRYYLDGTLVATHTFGVENCPDNVNLYYGCWIKNTEAVAKAGVMHFPRVALFNWTPF